MRVDVGSPYNCTKIALRYLLGNIIRPKLAKITENCIIYQNDIEEIIFEFPKLNYEYANSIALEDIPSFGQEEYGKFFYEYGRVLLANLVIAFTRLDWYSFGERATTDLKFVADYYDELIKLNNRVQEILDAFCDTIQLKHDPAMPFFDFLYPAFEIIKIKQGNAFSSDSPDMKNTQIMAFMYAGMWFSIIGYLFLLCEKTDVDGLSRISIAAETQREARVLLNSIAESQEDDDNKINICSLIITYFTINRFYRITSGLTIQDPLLELLGKFSSHLKELINDERDLVVFDTDLFHENSRTGPSLMAFMEKYDPLDDIGLFSQYGILRSDDTNIWAFGKEYINLYREQNTDDFIPLVTLIKPAFVKYINAFAPITSYLSSDNISIDKSFLFIKNLINGIEKERIGTVCPGTILQLTIIASTYRTIEKSSGFSRLNENKKLLIQLGIDIIDILILLLYQLWFLSGKFFIQPTRPKYCQNTAMNTLELLRKETLLILEEYFEFVKFGRNTDSPLYQEIIKQRLIRHDNITTEDIITKFHPINDKIIYITECAKHGIYSIAISALCYIINSDLTIQNLSYYSSKKPIDNTIIRFLSKYSEGRSTAFTEIPMIDAVFKAYTAVLSKLDEAPENFMIVVYALLYETIEQLLLKNSIGNYFDFNRADNLIDSYKVETIVSDLIKKPLQISLANQTVQQKLTQEQEREALW
jgi:hypothetical protein